jgi:hypothetical protein
MSAGKTSRVTDGPYANWGSDDDTAQIVLANGATLKLGQPLCIDVTQLGPDQNVPNNAALLPQCERLVATTSSNAGPLFGVLTGVTQGALTTAPQVAGLKLTSVNGIPTWTNSTGSNFTVTIQVRQVGWAYVYAGTVTGGRAVKIGDPLVLSTTSAFAVSSSTAIGGAQPTGQFIGTALGTAINTTEGGIPAGSGAVPTLGLGAPAGPGVVSVVPLSLAGIAVGSILSIDTIASGVQESVSVGSISYPTFSIALANAHLGNFKITGPTANAAISTNLISVANQQTTAALVAAWVNCTA